MVIIDGSFLLGIAAILSSLGNLWRIVRSTPHGPNSKQPSFQIADDCICAQIMAGKPIDGQP